MISSLLLLCGTENLIYSGMDDAEFEHVEKVTREKYEQEIARYKQEGEDIKEFRKFLLGRKLHCCVTRVVSG